MIQRFRAFELIEQINTDQGPVYTVCVRNNSFDNFYVKYIYQENHFDCLVYEILLQKLAIYFGLNTPEIAFIDVPEDIFTDVEVNNPFFYGGIVGFGSKDLAEAVLLVDEQKIYNKHDFNRYSNPLDVVRILMLDLHCDNRDRHDGNFNILINPRDFNLFVFDHYDCFGGTSKIGNMDPSSPFHLPSTIFRSDIFRSFCKWLEISSINNCIQQYIELAKDSDEINAIIEQCIEDVPESWNITVNLEDNLKQYLTDQDRIDRLSSVSTDIARIKQQQL